MKILLKRQQQRCFKELVEIIKVLAKVEGIEATDAIRDAYKIATIIGIKQDLDRVARGEVKTKTYKHWTDMFCLAVTLEEVITAGR